jgi:hypothetical protein
MAAFPNDTLKGVKDLDAPAMAAFPSVILNGVKDLDAPAMAFAAGSAFMERK